MSETIAKSIHEKLRSVVGESDNMIALHEPEFRGNEWDFVKECLDTGWVSSVGSYVDRFERDLEKFTGVKHAVAVMNGTAALHASLVILGIGEGDEVLIPAFTFVATANAIKYCGAEPHFVDIERETLGIDSKKLDSYLSETLETENGVSRNKKTGRLVKAIIPMHTFGHPSDIEGLLEVCEKFNLDLIEDAAESLGSFYKEKHTGNFGKLSTVSFNGNKVITTGGGGAILTNDTELAKRLVHITKTSKVPHRWEFIHDEVGFNYRLPNINAAIGCAQLENLSEYLESKRKLASKFEEVFKDDENVEFLTEPAGAKSNYWLNAIVLKSPDRKTRDSILEYTNANGIMTRPAWNLIPTLKPYLDSPRMEDLCVSESMVDSVINIPSSPFLGRRYD